MIIVNRNHSLDGNRRAEDYKRPKVHARIANIL
jgi:hypothetical protein